MCNSKKDLLLSMRQLSSLWEKDLDTAKFCGIHVSIIMVSSEPSAATESCFIVNSSFIKDYIVKHLGTLQTFLPSMHNALCIANNRVKHDVGQMGHDDY